MIFKLIQENNLSKIFQEIVNFDWEFKTGAIKWNRTTDLFITNEVLYP